MRDRSSTQKWSITSPPKENGDARHGCVVLSGHAHTAIEKFPLSPQWSNDTDFGRLTTFGHRPTGPAGPAGPPGMGRPTLAAPPAGHVLAPAESGT